MEAASKNKRGRPDIFSRKGISPMKIWMIQNFPEYGDRSIANQYYVNHGISIAESCLGKDEAKKVFSNERGSFKNKGIAEQIGRMSVQNNYDEESCAEILKQAIDLLNKGYKVKEVEKLIRDFRNNKQHERTDPE